MATALREPYVRASSDHADAGAASGLHGVLIEIARLADALCEDLADHQWDTASRIRHPR